MRVILNVDGKGKSYLLQDGTLSYYRKIGKALQDIKNGDHPDYLFFGFFTLCAATLEYSLNYLLTNHCLNQFGPEKYKKYAEGYIGLSFPKKLMMSPSILSNGSLVFKTNHSTYLALAEMITLRNKILHNKEFLKEVQIPLDQFWEKDEFEFSVELETNYIDKLNKDSCLKLAKALEDFRNYVMLPFIQQTLEGNELLEKTG